MSLKSFAAKIFAKNIALKTAKWRDHPIETQDQVFNQLISKAAGTKFGSDHGFDAITSHSDFVERVPIRDYEELKTYVEQVVAGKENILWPGKPIYFAKISGTTSGAKYIPITKTAIKHQVEAPRNAILNCIHETGNSEFVDGNDEGNQRLTLFTYLKYFWPLLTSNVFAIGMETKDI